MLEQDRLISAGGDPEDEAFDRAIRPRLLAEFVGQATVKKQMDIFIRAARNRGVQHLCVSCLAENAKMRTIAGKHEAGLRFEYDEVVGDIVPEGPDYFSLLAEAVDDRLGYLMAVLDLQHRVFKAA
jgi:hypothetical protein